MATPQIKVLPDLAGIAREAAEGIVQQASSAIRLNDVFTIALSGGSTPRALYELLATDEFKTQIDWPKVQIYFGDERCVPPDAKDSNYRMARQALFDRAPIPAANIHRIRAEADPVDAGNEYDRLLSERFGDSGLDLALLGMGDDGHAASLFPKSPAVNETSRLCVANWTERFKTWRVTMTAPFLNRSAEVLILVNGAAKAKRLHEVLEGPRDPERLPAQLIDPSHGKLTWIIDVAAAEMD